MNLAPPDTPRLFLPSSPAYDSTRYRVHCFRWSLVLVTMVARVVLATVFLVVLTLLCLIST